MRELRELRSKESVEFEHFFEIVRNKAAERNCVFFVDSGEGHNIIDGDIELSDLSGWLIPIKMADEFQRIFDAGNDEDIPDKWYDFFVFAEWKKTEKGYDVEFRQHG